MSGDYEVGYGRPPKRTRWKKGQSGNRGQRKKQRRPTTPEIDKLLLAPIDITENGKPRRVTTLEAILLQLWRKELAGNRRAFVTRLKYQELAQKHTEATTEITHGDSPYTDVSPPPSETNGDDKV
jgi:hypothetical protein